MDFFVRGGCVGQYGGPRCGQRYNLGGTCIWPGTPLFDHMVTMRDRTLVIWPLPFTFFTSQNGRLGLLLSILLLIFMKRVRPTEWKWEIKCSECVVLIWVFRGIRVPISLDQAWRSMTLLHGSGCSGAECWLLAEIGEAASPCLDWTFFAWPAEWWGALNLGHGKIKF